MKDQPRKGPDQGKKPYTKPEVRKVTLTPDEAVLGSCKVSTNGPAAANCGNPTWCFTHVS